VTVYFIADMHFGAEPLAGRRGFTNAAEMDEAIVAVWRSVVSDGDDVWIIGDVGDPDRLSDLPGRKRLVLGNTDKPIARYREHASIHEVSKVARLQEQGKALILVHKPEDAVTTQNEYVVHGHIHQKTFGNPRYLCVSVDQTAWGPIALQEVLRRLVE